MSSKQHVNLVQLLKETLDISPDCFCVADGKTVVYCNDTFADIYGLLPDEVIGQDSHTLLRQAWQSAKGLVIDTDDIDAWLADLDRVHNEIPMNQFETNLRDGRWFKMTRVSLKSGFVVILGVDITELKQTQLALETANKQIEQLANTDQLTGVANRRAFEAAAQRELAVARRYGEPLSLIALDIDHFKQINDSYGHKAGDEVLSHFARLCSAIIRDTDRLCRIGGEEFVVLLPLTLGESAMMLAERIRNQVEGEAFEVAGKQDSLAVTVSLGVSQLNDDDEAISQVLARADRALYQAKEQGRNRVARCLVHDDNTPVASR